MREGEGEPCKNKNEKRTYDNRELTARNGVAREGVGGTSLNQLQNSGKVGV